VGLVGAPSPSAQAAFFILEYLGAHSCNNRATIFLTTIFPLIVTAPALALTITILERKQRRFVAEQALAGNIFGRCTGSGLTRPHGDSSVGVAGLRFSHRRTIIIG
jgi:hypothetical protein